MPVCRLCALSIDIPADAVRIPNGRGRRGITDYLIDGRLHSFRKEKERIVVEPIQPIAAAPMGLIGEPELPVTLESTVETDRHRKHGVVQTLPKEGKTFFFIAGDDGQRYFTLCEDCNPPYGHQCLFTVGVAVLFESRPGNRKYRQAVQVGLADAPKLPQTEISIIDVWNLTHGFAHREVCGCPYT